MGCTTFFAPGAHPFSLVLQHLSMKKLLLWFGIDVLVVHHPLCLKVLLQIPVSLSTNPLVKMFCEFCRYGKSCKLPFKSSETVSTRPLELLHSDVCGPTPIPSVYGFIYYVLFVDDFSKFAWLFPLKSKAAVLDTFQLFKLQVENLLSFKIKTFLSDGGGEYLSSRIQSLLRKRMASLVSSLALTLLNKTDVQKGNTSMWLKLGLHYCLMPILPSNIGPTHFSLLHFLLIECP